MNEDDVYLAHIVRCIERIEEYVSDGRDSFMESPLIQDAVVHNLHIMAESTQRLTDPIKTSHPEIDWRRLSGLRNILVHAYLGVNLVTVWETVENDLQEFKRQIEAIIQELESGP